MKKSMYKNNFYSDHISESRHIAAQAAAYNYLYRKSAWARWFRLGFCAAGRLVLRSRSLCLGLFVPGSVTLSFTLGLRVGGFFMSAILCCFSFVGLKPVVSGRIEPLRT